MSHSEFTFDPTWEHEITRSLERVDPNAEDVPEPVVEQLSQIVLGSGPVHPSRFARATFNENGDPKLLELDAPGGRFRADGGGSPRPPVTGKVITRGETVGPQTYWGRRIHNRVIILTLIPGTKNVTALFISHRFVPFTPFPGGHGTWIGL